MRLVTRAQWRARPRGQGAATPFDPLGTTVHWEGAGWVWPWAHATCDDKMRAMQSDHMDRRGWSDIGYSFVACPHGYVFEGRGLNRRSAANGTYDANTDWYATQCMWGSRSGPAPAVLLSACRDAIDYCRNQGGAGLGLRGHRDHKSTDCPGDQLYAWVRSGAPRPNQPNPPPEDELSQAEVNQIVGAINDGFADLRRDLGVHLTKIHDSLTLLPQLREELGTQFTTLRDNLGTHLTVIEDALQRIETEVSK